MLENSSYILIRGRAFYTNFRHNDSNPAIPYHAKTESLMAGVREQYLHPYRDLPTFNITDSPLSGLKNPTLITFHATHSDGQLITH